MIAGRSDLVRVFLQIFTSPSYPNVASSSEVGSPGLNSTRHMAARWFWPARRRPHRFRCQPVFGSIVAK